MPLLSVAIDTSHNKRYSCVISGSQKDLNDLYKAMDKIFVSYNEKGPFHWRRLRKNTKRSAESNVYKLINSTSLHFNIFEHKLPANISRKEFYLKHIPNAISSGLDKWLEGKDGTVIIHVDNDYLVKDIKDSTRRFIKNLIRRFCERLIGPVKIRTNKDVRATIKQMNGKILDFIGSVSSRSSSKGIQIADIVLGYYLYDKSGIEKKVYFKRI